MLDVIATTAVITMYCVHIILLASAVVFSHRVLAVSSLFLGAGVITVLSICPVSWCADLVATYGLFTVVLAVLVAEVLSVAAMVVYVKLTYTYLVV